MEYEEDDFLQLSGLQHFRFCRRRWALIHVENLWAENERTIEGELMHQRAHDPTLKEKRKDVIVTHGINVHSRLLGVSGQCDVLELHRDPNGIPLPGRRGLWTPYPVEYKRGQPNERAGDELQLCGQAMCLEEMLCCKVREGALFYGEIRRRRNVVFTLQLRQEVKKSLTEMHDFMRRGYTPKVKPSKSCNACSLRDLCLPKLMNARSVSDYLQKNAREQP